MHSHFDQRCPEIGFLKLCCGNIFSLLDLSAFYRSEIDTRRAMESLTEHMTTSQRQDSVSCGCVFHHQYFKNAF